eukprot:5041865-Ditylum_brightwellii.AAC.1
MGHIFYPERETKIHPPKTECLSPRSMTNMLKPVGIPSFLYIPPSKATLDPHLHKSFYGIQTNGNTIGNHPLPTFNVNRPMPANPAVIHGL